MISNFFGGQEILQLVLEIRKIPPILVRAVGLLHHVTLCVREI